MEKNLLVLLVAQSLEDKFHEIARSHGHLAKLLSLSAAEAKLFLLVVIKDACDLLIKQEQESKS